MRFTTFLLLSSLFLAAACGARRPTGGGTPDAGMGSDGATIGTDSGPGHDAGTTTPDAGTTTPDAGGGMCAGGPLALPIAGCTPTPVPNTGDPHADCVARINQFRHDCQCLPPLMRWTAGEACADQDAMYDAMHPGTPHAGFMAMICASGYGQNECPGWDTPPMVVDQCLQLMWDEGPGPFHGPPDHGHYINMSSTSFTMVACGYYDGGAAGLYAVQNFQ